LKEQARALSDATKGILQGKVEVGTRGNSFTIALSIIAPALNNYEYEVVRVQHGIELYPAQVVSASEARVMKCQDEEELTAALGSILGSEKTSSVIASLIAQSKAM
jgi:hypothetical protein